MSDNIFEFEDQEELEEIIEDVYEDVYDDMETVEERLDELAETVEDLIERKQYADLRDLLVPLEAADIAAEKFAAVTAGVPAVFGSVKVIHGVPVECIAVAQHGTVAGWVMRDPERIDIDEKLYPAGQVFDGGLRFAVNFAGSIGNVLPGR